MTIEAGGQGGTAGAAGAAGEAGTAGMVGACQRNTDCLSDSVFQAICREGTCVPLISGQCSRVVGNVSDEPEEIFGLMVPLTNVPPQSSTSAFGNSYIAAMQLAYDELTKTQSSEKGPLYVVCDEGTSPEKAAQHLIENVGVKAIVGPAWGPAIAKVLPLVKESPSTLLWLPLADDPQLLKQDLTANQIWLGKPNRQQQVSYWQAAIAEVEKYLLPKLDSEPLKLALVVAGDSSSQNLASQIVDKTIFNQKNTADNAAEQRYFRLDYGDFRASPQIDYTQLATALVQHPSGMVPNLIVIISSGDGAQKVVPAVEINWKQGPRPRYLIVGGSEWIGETLPTQVPGSKLEERYLSLDPLRDEATAKRLLDFRAAFSTKNTGSAPRAESEYYYDAFWENLYIFYRAAKRGVAAKDLTLDHFVEGVSSLNPPGLGIPVGPAGLMDAFSTLAAADGDIDLGGTSSPLDFAGNAPQTQGSLNCLLNFKLSPSGVTFDPGTGMAQGNNVCP